MLHDLDGTLKLLLDDTAAPAELRGADVSFETPEKTYQPTQATVNLFLYDVKENVELRDPMPVSERQGDRFVRRLAPLRMGCSYMVTAWSKKTGAARIAEEHQLLGQALLWLRNFPTIPATYLQGSLAGQPFPPPALVAQADGTANLGEFWSALGIAPRPSFSLLVTVAMSLVQRVEGPLVTTRTTMFAVGDGTTPETQTQIGGRVLDQAAQGIAGALVEVLDAGLRTTSDEEGRFTFARVPTGTRSFRVTAVGFTPGTQTIVVPGVPGAYEISLAPLP